jgi:hypothetical protein
MRNAASSLSMRSSGSAAAMQEALFYESFSQYARHFYALLRYHLRCRVCFTSRPFTSIANSSARIVTLCCLSASGQRNGPSPAVSRTPITRCRPIPAPSNACACDWKTETDARSADRLPTHPAPIPRTLRNPCACPPLPPQYRFWASPRPNTLLSFSHADQFLQIGHDEIQGTLDAPAVGQHQPETSLRSRFLKWTRAPASSASALGAREASSPTLSSPPRAWRNTPAASSRSLQTHQRSIFRLLCSRRRDPVPRRIF